MNCREIYLSLDSIDNVSGDEFTMVDEFGNYVFYGLSRYQITGTYSVGNTSSNYLLSSLTQSGLYSTCYNPPYDGDANAFILATQIATSSVVGVTPSIVIPAVHKLVVDLKSNGLWNKLYAIYPFVGATPSAHKYNLKDPRDLDAAFRLAFTGGFTHQPTGILPDGSSGWADTKFTPSTNLSGTSSVSLGYYSRTNDTGNRMAFSNSSGNRLFLYLNFTAGDLTIFDCYGTVGGFRASTTGIDTLGLLIGSRTTTSDSRLYKNGIQVGASQSTLNGVSPSTGTINMFRQASPSSLFSNCECAFGFIGDGLTSGEVLILNTIVETFQDSLSRGV